MIAVTVSCACLGPQWLGAGGAHLNERPVPVAAFAREALEARMLEGLRERLMAPEVAAEAMRAYAEETNRLNWERRSSGDADRREPDKITRSIKEIVAAIRTGAAAALWRDGFANLRQKRTS
jgi:site-specific DNA recombinase